LILISHVRFLFFCFSFTFTQLDAGAPERTFSFILTANEEDAYIVDECDDLDDEALEPLLEKLNKSDDLSAFMLEIRKCSTDVALFCNLLDKLPCLTPSTLALVVQVAPSQKRCKRN
jgi:hypothetical protein